MPDTSQTPTTILLGASNLTIGFPLIFENLRRGFAAPIQVSAAMGHGRSYGQWSRVLWRGLPGIVDCGLWDALSAADDDRARRRLLLTDVGNDLVYGVSVDQILAWVETSIERVGANPEKTILTLPPVETLLQIASWRYNIMRTVIFPGCRIPLSSMRDLVIELGARLESLGTSRGISVFKPDANWFGFDPIHIRSDCRSDAWRSILSCWPDFDTTNWAARVDGSRKIPRHHRIPALHTSFGCVQSQVQPVATHSEYTLSVF